MNWWFMRWTWSTMQEDGGESRPTWSQCASIWMRPKTLRRAILIKTGAFGTARDTMLKRLPRRPLSIGWMITAKIGDRVFHFIKTAKTSTWSTSIKIGRSMGILRWTCSRETFTAILWEWCSAMPAAPGDIYIILLMKRNAALASESIRWGHRISLSILITTTAWLLTWRRSRDLKRYRFKHRIRLWARLNKIWQEQKPKQIRPKGNLMRQRPNWAAHKPKTVRHKRTIQTLLPNRPQRMPHSRWHKAGLMQAARNCPLQKRKIPSLKENLTIWPKFKRNRNKKLKLLKMQKRLQNWIWQKVNRKQKRRRILWRKHRLSWRQPGRLRN